MNLKLKSLLYAYLQFKYFNLLVDEDKSNEDGGDSDTPSVSSDISGVTEPRGDNAEGK